MNYVRVYLYGGPEDGRLIAVEEGAETVKVPHVSGLSDYDTETKFTFLRYVFRNGKYWYEGSI